MQYHFAVHPILEGFKLWWMYNDSQADLSNGEAVCIYQWIVKYFSALFCVSGEHLVPHVVMDVCKQTKASCLLNDNFLLSLWALPS
jgi:hypothetical protein